MRPGDAMHRVASASASMPVGARAEPVAVRECVLNPAFSAAGCCHAQMTAAV